MQKASKSLVYFVNAAKSHHEILILSVVMNIIYIKYLIRINNNCNVSIVTYSIYIYTHLFKICIVFIPNIVKNYSYLFIVLHFASHTKND